MHYEYKTGNQVSMKNMRDELNTLSHSSRWNDILSSKIGFLTHDQKFYKVADRIINIVQVKEKVDQCML